MNFIKFATIAAVNRDILVTSNGSQSGLAENRGELVRELSEREQAWVGGGGGNEGTK